MKPSNNEMNYLSHQLQQLPQSEIPQDIFSEIQRSLDKKSFIRKHQIISSLSMLSLLVLCVLFFTQRNRLDEKDVFIQELVKRTQQLESLLIAEAPTYSTPGSVITERIVNIESYLAKLDKSILQTRDKQIKSQLMATKLDLLGDLVLLQRKINLKPDYQKVKPFII